VNILAPAPRTETMSAFDALPDRIRRAMALADFPYDPREIAERLAKGRREITVARSIEKRRTSR
jgi:hypothetical protein